MVLLLALAAWAQDSPRVLFDRAAQALTEGRFAEAEAGFREVLQAEPANLSALANLGVVYAKTERFDLAVEAYERALKLRPEAGALRLNLGLALLKQERHADALAQFERVPTEQGRELAATCLVELRRPEEALAILDALPESPGRLYLRLIANLQRKDAGAATDSVSRMARSMKNPAASAFFLGRAMYQAERFEEARASYEQARRADPAYPGVAREIGKACVSLRDEACAEREFRAALQTDASDFETRYFLGSLLTQHGQAAEGLELLERAQRDRPGFWAPHYYVGKARLQTGDVEGAIRHLEKAVKLNPEESSAWYQLGLALQKAGRSADARAAMERVRKLKRQ
jgi:superkiller protein 3